MEGIVTTGSAESKDYMSLSVCCLYVIRKTKHLSYVGLDVAIQNMDEENIYAFMS